MGWLRWLECFGFLTSDAHTKGPKVPEQYLKPQGLYPSSERIDLKKLRKLIIDGRLVACYPGLEESNSASCDETEECPICMLMYPVLNTSRCCAKRVCTECFLQFCGGRSEESKNEEKLAEQNVLEARIREREEEVRRDQERVLARSLLPAQPPVAVEAAAVPVVRSAARSRTTSIPVASHHPHGTHRRRTSSSVNSRSDSPVAASSRQGGHGSPSRHAAVEPRGAGGSAVSATVVGQTEGSAAIAQSGNGATVQASASRRRYRLADFIPTGVVDIAVSVEDINAYMLEQAMYDSIAAAAADAVAIADESTAVAQSTARDSPPRRASPATAQRRRHSRLSSSRSAAMQDTSAVLAALLPLALQAAGMNQPPPVAAHPAPSATLHETDHATASSFTATAATSNYNSESLCVLPSTASASSTPPTPIATPSGDDSDTPLHSNRRTGRHTASRLASPALPTTPAGTETLQPAATCTSSYCSPSDGFSTLLTLPASPAAGNPSHLFHPEQPHMDTTAAVPPLSPVALTPEPLIQPDAQVTHHTLIPLLLVEDVRPTGNPTDKPTTPHTPAVVCVASLQFESAAFLSSSESISSVVFPSLVGTSSGGGSLTTSKSHTRRAPPCPPAGTPAFRSASSSAAGFAALTQTSLPLDPQLFSACETLQSQVQSDLLGVGQTVESGGAAAADASERNSLKLMAARLALQGTPGLQERSPYIGMVMQVMTSVYQPPAARAAAVSPPPSHAGSSSNGGSATPVWTQVLHMDDPSPTAPPATALLENPDGSMYIITSPLLVATQAAAAKAACMQASSATADMPEHLLRAAVATAAYSDAAAQPYSLGSGTSVTEAYADGDVCLYSSSGAAATAQLVREMEDAAANAGYADYSLSNAETGECSMYSVTGQGLRPTGSGLAWNAASMDMRDGDRSLVAAMVACDAQIAAALAAQDAAASSSSSGAWAYSTAQQQQHSDDRALVERLAAADARLQAGFPRHP